MDKTKIKRLGLLMFQHLLAVCIMAAAAYLLLNSYIVVDSIDGTQVYRIFPMDRELEFEESEIYHTLFRNAVSDITQLVVIKGQLETDGVLDPFKEIDVTEYAKMTGVGTDCDITAVYELDNIIKWGKYGVEYTNRIMSISEFVNYFGDCFFPENFGLDEYGQLVFLGFHRVGRDGETFLAPSEETETDPVSEESGEDEDKSIEELLAEYAEEQLDDLVFSYMIKCGLDVEMSREDDGRLIVSVPMLNCRYATVDGRKQLTHYADNWVDYMNLQNNVAAAIDSLTLNYQRYQVCNEVYKEEHSNVKYMVRMMTDGGICTYTNVELLKGMEDNEVTEFFGEFRRYLIYYPDSLVYMGNTVLSEEELDQYISLYNYAYPDTTHIWLGIDANYAIEEDVFHSANALYQKIIPNVNRIMGLIVMLVLVWLGLGVYLTATAAALNRFDRIWTEGLLLLAGGLCYLAYFSFGMIMEIAGTAGAVPAQWKGIRLTNLHRYGVFMLYGMFVSGALSLVWYSVVRRMKAESLWKGSFLYFLCMKAGCAGRFILRHKNSAISTLLPYNLFLFCNLAGIVAVYELWAKQVYVLLILGCMVVVDGLVGVLLFRHNVEQNEIVEGINRIRDGEEDFKIETENLHGSSAELADAVNNIGEGIRNAVTISMKDEKLKTDLITNVSHDIKTPLTSIINYVDLLKRQNIEYEPAKGYIEILDSKAQRLKQLTDDLVEASKISSGNLELDLEKLNLTELIHQSLGEFSEKLQECGLQVVFEGGDVPAFVCADSRRMWRVVENLFNNICKYALEGTRVYIDMQRMEGRIVISVKNISRQQMNIRPEELTERFIRGDSSRTTEGSGLGLSIAKSLVQVQGGSFEIILDGDLFKVCFSFPETDM